MPRIGELKHYITIQTPTRVADSSGGWVESWSDFANAYAKIKPASARERYFADKIEHNVSHVIEIRYIDGITSEMRISFDSRVFHVRGFRVIDEVERFIEIAVEEGVAS